MKSLPEYMESIRNTGDKIGRIWVDDNGVLFQKLLREQIDVLEEILLKKTDENG